VKKVLIIEDNVDMRVLERTVLEERGYEVLEADNAKDGITLAIESVPDIILMDIRLPSKKRGIGAAKILRENEKTRNIPIIFVTGYPGVQDSGEIEHIDNCSYMAKPVELKELIKKIKKYTG
jgi:two-component system cell cycle response regulator DivK